MAESLLTNIEQRASDLQFQLQYKLQPLEDLRLEYKKQLKIFRITVIVSLVALAAIVWLLQYFQLGFGAIILVIGYAVWYFVKLYPLKNDLTEKFHKEIVPHIISEFVSQTNFQPDGCINYHDYYASHIFQKSVDKYDGGNLITGLLGQTALQFSNLHTQYKTTTTDSKGNTKTEWHTIFKGVFLIADSNKNFNGEIYILPDTAERLLGGIGRWMQDKFGSSGRGEMIYMEDPDFEKRYVVYATDPVEARYILTPSMQHYFLELSNRYGKDCVHASFVNGKLHLALSGYFELFTINLSRSFKDEQTTKHYVENLVRILSSVEILDLNTRIWNR